jgi:hypothetical protein
LKLLGSLSPTYKVITVLNDAQIYNRLVASHDEFRWGFSPGSPVIVATHVATKERWILGAVLHRYSCPEAAKYNVFLALEDQELRKTGMTDPQQEKYRIATSAQSKNANGHNQYFDGALRALMLEATRLG